MNGLVETLRGLGPTRLLVMGLVAAGLVSAMVVLSTRLATPQMALLYGSLDIDDSAEIVNQLETMNVRYELRANGSQVLVPSAQVMRLRLAMAQESLPSGGSVGYEIFDRGDTLGATSFMQNLNRVRALEGELARTIRTIDGVAGARVHLVLPERQVFSRQRRKPSASIILKMRGSARLQNTRVKAVQHLVSAAVPELEPDGVSVIDDRGVLLTRGATDAATASTSSLIEAQSAQELRFKQAIESLVEESVGAGKVRAEVSVDLNFDRITTNSELFDPESQVARSTQSVEETSRNQEGGADQAVTVASNLPEDSATQGDGQTSNSENQRTEETVNYEISKTVKTRVHESGTIKRLSVAVLVDGTYATEADGKQQYTPRSQEDLKRIAALVKSAIGFDEARGDRVEIVNMRFNRLAALPAAESEEEGGFMAFLTADYLRLAEILALLVISALFLLVVARPLLAVLMGSVVPAQREAASALPGPGQKADALPPPANDQLPVIDHSELVAKVEAGEISPQEAQQIISHGKEDGNPLTEQMIDIAKIEGQVRASSVRKVGELVTKHPEEALSILRSWMYQDA